MFGADLGYQLAGDFSAEVGNFGHTVVKNIKSRGQD